MNRTRLATLPLALTTAFAVAGCNPPGPKGLTQGLTNLAVVTSRDGANTAGSINTIDRTTKKITTGIDTTLDADHVVRVSDGKLFVLNRTKGNVRRYNPLTWAVEAEVKAGDATHSPAMAFVQDLIPLPGTTKVFVTSNANDGAHALMVVDTATPTADATFISLPVASNDVDGKPEAAPMHFCAGKLYVGLQDLDTNNFMAAGPGRVAIVDPVLGAVTGVIPLAHTNPTQIVGQLDDCSKVWVVTSGPFGEAPSAKSAIEKLDLTTLAASTLTDGSKLAGVPAGLVPVSSQLAIVSVNFDLQTLAAGYSILARNKLVAINPTTGAIVGDASDQAGFMPFTAVSPDNELWFATDNFASVNTDNNLPIGVWVGKADGKKGPYTQLDVGQKPYGIVFPYTDSPWALSLGPCVSLVCRWWCC